MTSHAIRLARLALLLVLAFILVRHAVDNRADYAFLAELDWRYLLPIALLGLFRLLLEAVRYSATARAGQRQLPLKNAFVYLIIARVFDKFLPQSGLVYKARMLQKAGGADTREIFSIIGSMVWMQVFFTLVVAVLVVSILHPDLEIARVSALTALTAVLLLQLAGTLMVSAFGRQLAGISPSGSGAWRRLLHRLLTHLDALMTLITRPWLFIVSALTLIASTLASMLRLYLCFRMLGAAVDAAVVTVFVALNRLMSVFVLTPGNLGVTELLYGALSQELGIGMAQGVAAALVIRLVMFGMLALMGFLMFVFARRTVTGEDSFETTGRNADSKPKGGHS